MLILFVERVPSQLYHNQVKVQDQKLKASRFSNRRNSNAVVSRLATKETDDQIKCVVKQDDLKCNLVNYQFKIIDYNTFL